MHLRIVLIIYFIIGLLGGTKMYGEELPHSLTPRNFKFIFKDSDRGTCIEGVYIVVRFPENFHIEPLTGISNAGGEFSFNLNDTTVNRAFLDIVNYSYEPIEAMEVHLKEIEQYIKLEPRVVKLDELIIVSKPRSINVGFDTLSYSGDALVTEVDQNLEDVVSKIPEIEIVDGKAFVDGVKVTNITINGNNYIKNSTKLALDNIPADIIEEIQIIDVVSNKETQEEVKQVNVKFKPEAGSSFGNAYGNVGTISRYDAGFDFYREKANSQFTVVGQSNNINNENILSGFLPSTYSGINSLTGSLVNFDYSPKQKLILHFDFSYNNVKRFFDNEKVSTSIIEPKQFFNTTYQQTIKESLPEANFNVSIPLSKSVTLSSNLGSRFLQSSSESGSVDAAYFNNENLFSFNTNTQESTDQKVLNGGVSLDAVLGKARKTGLSIDVSYMLENKSNERSIYSSLSFPEMVNSQNEMQILSPVFSSAYKVKVKSKNNLGNSFFSMQYDEVASTQNISNDFLYEMNDTPLNIGQDFSSDYSFGIDKYKINIGHNKFIGKWRVGGNLSYLLYNINTDDKLENIQGSNTGMQVLPELYLIRKTNVLKSLSIRFNKKEKLPVLEQFVPVTSQLNGTSYIQGSQQLKVQYSNRLVIDFKGFGDTYFRNDIKYIFAVEQDFIGQSLSILSNDSSIGNVLLPSGSVLMKWGNLGRSMRHDILIKHSKKVPRHSYFLKYGLSYLDVPGVFQEVSFNSFVTRYLVSISEAFKVSSKLQSKFIGSFNYSTVLSSLSDVSKSELVSWNIRFNLTAKVFNRVRIKVETFSYQSFKLGELLKVDVVNTVNISTSARIFKSRRGVVKFYVFDLFNQNKDVLVSPDPNFLIFDRKSLIQRYFSFGFTYKM